MGKSKSKEEWREIFRRHAASGLSREQFCKKNNIAKSVFWNWKKKLKGECHIPQKPKFVEIPYDSQSSCSSTTEGTIELKFPNGTILTMRQ